MPAIDDLIKQWVRDAERSGELSRNPHVGKPLNLDDGFDATPEELRVTHRILKHAGYRPAEVEMMRRLASLRDELRAATGEPERARLRRAVAELQARLTLRLERHRRSR